MPGAVTPLTNSLFKHAINIALGVSQLDIWK